MRIVDSGALDLLWAGSQRSSGTERVNDGGRGQIHAGDGGAAGRWFVCDRPRQASSTIARTRVSCILIGSRRDAAVQWFEHDSGAKA
jgi:hypothetical protein